jgi:hypothetical protein
MVASGGLFPLCRPPPLALLALHAVLRYSRLTHWRFASPADGQSGRTLSDKIAASTR